MGKTNLLQLVNIDYIIPSKTNPRVRFDKDSLKDLIENIKEKGIIYPLLCRVKDIALIDHFDRITCIEIVNGERRYKAARIIGLKEIPVEVRVMNDDEAIEAQLISFEQSEDIHPLERAEAIFRLKKTVGNVSAVASTIGKSNSYVEQSLSLLSLIEPAKKAFRANYLTLGHAILLCRLQPADQKRAFEFAVKSWQKFDGDYDYSNDLNPQKDDERFDRLDDPARTVCSVKDLREFIEARINLDLSKAAFDTSDASLYEKTGACTTCPLRTGFNKDLFNDITKGDFCTNAPCYHIKQEAFLIRLKAGLKKNKKRYIEITKDQRKPAGHPGSLTERSFKYITGKPCKYSRIGIFIDADSKGKTAPICSAKKECKQHFSAEIKYKAESGQGSRSSKPQISYEEQQRLQKIAREKGEKRFKALVAEIWKKIPAKIDISHARLIEMLAELLSQHEISRDLEQYKPKEIKPSNEKLINIGLLSQKFNFDLRYDGSIHPDIYKACKELKIKFEPILQKISDEEKAVEKKLQEKEKKESKDQAKPDPTKKGKKEKKTKK